MMYSLPRNQRFSKRLLWGTLPLIGSLFLLLGISVINIGTSPEELAGSYKLLPMLPNTLYYVLFVLSLASTIILLGLVIIARREQRRKRSKEPLAEESKRSSFTQLIILLSTLLLPLLVILYLYHSNRTQVEENLQHLIAFFRDLSAFLQGESSLLVYESPLLGYLLFGTFSFLFLAFIMLGGWLIWGGYDDLEETSEEESATESLLRTIDASLETLAGDDDPRTGIIATYRHFEVLLAAHGFGRRPSATPVEFMREALHQFPIPPEHIHGLTALFQQAKFSHHPMYSWEKARALSHLEAIRDSLKATEPHDAYTT